MPEQWSSPQGSHTGNRCIRQLPEIEYQHLVHSLFQPGCRTVQSLLGTFVPVPPEIMTIHVYDAF